MIIPQSEGDFLHHVEAGGNGNENDDTVPKYLANALPETCMLTLIQDLV